MAQLSDSVIKSFVKEVQDATINNLPSETIVEKNGNAKIIDGALNVQVDGSSEYTPCSTLVAVRDGDRVKVQISNHHTTIVGNLDDSPLGADTLADVLSGALNDYVITNSNIIDSTFSNGLINGSTIKDSTITGSQIADSTITDSHITSATFDKIEGDALKAVTADIDNILANSAKIESLDATDVDISNKLTAANADIEKLQATDVDISNSLTAVKAEIESLDATYATIDFANINQAAIEKVFADSGIIEDLVVSEGHITGMLVGVTIKGDLIEGNTVVADKLVIKGSDGLFYKLNTDGITTTAEQTEYNSLSGTVITAKSITAEKVNVDDLVAFDATIGGFNITSDAIYSGVKASADNTTRGIYLDNTGQMSIGDSSNYLKYYKDTDGTWKLAISAQSLIFSSTNKNVEDTINELDAKAIVSSIEEFYRSTSPTSLSGGSWSTTQPTWTDGTYIWRRTKVTYGDGSSEYTPSSTGVCITGNTGKGIASTVVTYQSSTSGTTTPTGTWTTSIPTVAAGSYLWTRTVITYTDGTTTTSYSVTLQGKTGATGATGASGSNGVGISSTVITYQAGNSQITVPTGTWNSSVPTLTTALPYLWTRTVLTYTDSTTSTSYSVSSTLESFELGGRNLIRRTKDFFIDDNREVGWYNPGGWTFEELDEDEFIIADIFQTGLSSNNIPSLYSSKFTVSYGDNLTFSCWFMVDDTSAWDGVQAPYIFEIYNSSNTRVQYQDVNITASNTNKPTVTSGEWVYFYSTHTVTATDAVAAAMRVSLFRNGSIHIKKCKCEIGNKPTDWTPAPDDLIDNSADVAEQAKEEAIDAATSNAQDIVDGLNIGDSADLIEYLGSDYTGGTTVYEVITTLLSQTTSLEQTTESFNFNFESLVDQVTIIDGTLNTEVIERLKYIRFEDGSIILGDSDSPFKIKITNEKISFLFNEDELAYINTYNLNIEEANVNHMTIEEDLHMGIGEQRNFLTNPGFTALTDIDSWGVNASVSSSSSYYDADNDQIVWKYISSGVHAAGQSQYCVYGTELYIKATFDTTYISSGTVKIGYQLTIDDYYDGEDTYTYVYQQYLSDSIASGSGSVTLEGSLTVGFDGYGGTVEPIFYISSSISGSYYLSCQYFQLSRKTFKWFSRSNGNLALKWGD